MIIRWIKNCAGMKNNIRSWAKDSIFYVQDVTKGQFFKQSLNSVFILQDWLPCREEENLVFWFGAQIISTLNFTQSGWLILFSPDLHFRLAKRVSGQTHSLRRETATRTVMPLVVPA